MASTTLTQGAKLPQGVLKGTNVLALTASIPTVPTCTVTNTSTVVAEWVVPFPFRVLACAYHLVLPNDEDLLNVDLQVNGTSILAAATEDLLTNKTHSGLMNISKPFKEYGKPTYADYDHFGCVQVKLEAASAHEVITSGSFTLFIQPVTD